MESPGQAHPEALSNDRFWRKADIEPVGDEWPLWGKGDIGLTRAEWPLRRAFSSDDEWLRHLNVPRS